MSVSAGAACPACGGALSATWHEQRHVRRCVRCRGLWISAMDLYRHVRPASSPSPTGGLAMFGATPSSRCCVDCRTPMQTARAAESGVQFEWCAQHGVWLDDEELERLGAAERRTRTTARATSGASDDMTMSDSVIFESLGWLLDLLGRVLIHWS